VSKTEKNLQEAFAGESQANRKYLAFADQAEKEGKPQAVKNTRENLKEAISGETQEFKSMYPRMIEEAKEEGHKIATRGFTYANAVEEVHAGLYQKALDNLDSLEEVDYYVCSVCGYTCEMEPPEKCPVCGASPKAFMKID